MFKELSNYQIMDLLKKYKLLHNFSGIYSKDDLPSKLKPNTFYIVNMQNKNEGNGTHWVSFFYSNNSIYFDSFGAPAPKEVEQKISPYIYSDKDIQDINSEACGYFSIAFIKYLNSKSNKYKAFDIFNQLFRINTKLNEAILKHTFFDEKR